MSTRNRSRNRQRPNSQSASARAAAQPRESAVGVKGRFTERFRQDGDLGDMTDSERYTALFAPLDAFSIRDGEIVDYNPAEGGEALNAYQTIAANGFEYSL